MIPKFMPFRTDDLYCSIWQITQKYVKTILRPFSFQEFFYLLYLLCIHACIYASVCMYAYMFVECLRGDKKVLIP